MLSPVSKHHVSRIYFHSLRIEAALGGNLSLIEFHQIYVISEAHLWLVASRFRVLLMGSEQRQVMHSLTDKHLMPAPLKVYILNLKLSWFEAK